MALCFFLFFCFVFFFVFNFLTILTSFWKVVALVCIQPWNVYVPLRVDGDGEKCIQYNSHRMNHI